jgi:hypothetical protein
MLAVWEVFVAAQRDMWRFTWEFLVVRKCIYM